MRLIVFISLITLTLTSFSQTLELPENKYQQEFDNAYQLYPNVPRGVLEAVSFTTTRMQHIQNAQESCAGLPAVYGVMGLTLDGKGYFNNNLIEVSNLSGVSVEDIKNNPSKNILAFAAAYESIAVANPVAFTDEELLIALYLIQLSELPNNTVQQQFALNCHLYSVLSFMNNKEAQQKYNFPNYNFDLEAVFGKENLKVLSSPAVMMTEEGISTATGDNFKGNTNLNKSQDYPPALQNLTTCNFSSRNGTPVSAVTVHTIQGSYAGAISWAHNCSVPSNVSYHYVLRSSDGQVTQVVLESDKGWHVGSENPYTIGMEHEGFVNDSTWYTAAMYQSSANLVVDITQSGYGINPMRTAYFPWANTTHYNQSSRPGGCIRIKGHQHYPNQSHTDPDYNWDWDYYYKLINASTTTVTTTTAQSGNHTDSGGSSGNYGDDERTLFLIQPTGAQSITLTVNQFDIEADWDYLYIYEGSTVYDPLVGRYDGTTIPSSININGGSVLIEFRTDCATNEPGYDISWNASVITGIEEGLQDNFKLYPNPTKDILNIEFENDFPSQVVLMDVSGRLMRTIQINGSKETIDLKEMASGVYFLKVKERVVKVIKD